MPEINITVKIIGGKKTDTAIYVEARSINEKRITFKNGANLSEHDLICLIDRTVLDFIDQKGQSQLFTARKLDVQESKLQNLSA